MENFVVERIIEIERKLRELNEKLEKVTTSAKQLLRYMKIKGQIDSILITREALYTIHTLRDTEDWSRRDFIIEMKKLKIKIFNRKQKEKLGIGKQRRPTTGSRPILEI